MRRARVAHAKARGLPSACPLFPGGKQDQRSRLSVPQARTSQASLFSPVPKPRQWEEKGADASLLRAKECPGAPWCCTFPVLRNTLSGDSAPPPTPHPVSTATLSQAQGEGCRAFAWGLQSVGHSARASCWNKGPGSTWRSQEFPVNQEGCWGQETRVALAARRSEFSGVSLAILPARDGPLSSGAGSRGLSSAVFSDPGAGSQAGLTLPGLPVAPPFPR